MASMNALINQNVAGKNLERGISEFL